MRMLTKPIVLPAIVAAFLLNSCTKENDETTAPASPVAGKLLLFEGHSDDAGVDVKVYADKALFTGYNRIYVTVFESGSGARVKDAHISFHPEMTMTGGMSHAAPAEDPLTTTPENGVFEGSAVFVMPSEGNGQWSIEVHVHNHGSGKEGEVKGNVSVADPDGILLYSFIAPGDSAQYFVSLAEPIMPVVGENDFEVVVHKMNSAESWSASTALHIDVEPYMPAMGHGSSGNLSPLETSRGHYAGGLVNLTMAGLWHLRMTVRDASDNIMDDAHHFEISL